MPTDRRAVARVAIGTDEKRHPGLFETIIRRSIPLVVARSAYLSLSLSLLATQQLANRLRGSKFPDERPRRDGFVDESKLFLRRHPRLALAR